MSQDHGVSKSVNGKTEGYWSESLNIQSKITCGYWYSSIFITSKRTRSFLMSLDGSVEEYLCHIQSRKPSASLIYTYWWVACHTRERWSKNIVTNWHATNDSMITNNHINNNNKNDNHSNSNNNLEGLF